MLCTVDVLRLDCNDEDNHGRGEAADHGLFYVKTYADGIQADRPLKNTRVESR